VAKQAKKTQTDWTRGGKAISDTAIPLYQKNLTRMDEYLENPTARVDELLNQYYTNTPKENDFLRNYQRAMGNVTANNYGATTGGYASRNQQNYDDYQRYMNDYAARLRAEGVNNAYNMAQGFYGNMLQANPQYQAAYNLGQPYSDVEQYNDMVDQLNSNAWAGWVGDAGKVIGSIPTPWTMAIGAAMQGVGSAFQMDDSALRSMQGTANNYGLYQNAMNNANQMSALGNLFSGVQDGYNWLRNRNLANRTNQLANLQNVQGQRGNFDFLIS
jgi:hypothetical protein